MKIRFRTFALITLMLLSPLALATQGPEQVFISTADGGRVDADLYGSGSHAVVFAHGAIFNKQSWAPLAKRIASHGYRALAINFRGYGKSRTGSDRNALYLDVMAAVRWLHEHGVKDVDLVGGSMGGGAAGEAATRLKPGELNKLVLLSAMPIDNPQDLHAKSILFIASRGEGLEPTVQEQYSHAPKPKQLILLDGSAHAQNIFATAQAQTLSDDIVSFILGK